MSLPLSCSRNLAALSLPQPRGRVIRGGEHTPAIRAKDRAMNIAGVALESDPADIELRAGASGHGPKRGDTEKECAQGVFMVSANAAKMAGVASNFHG
jgi:hypothetical protein